MDLVLSIVQCLTRADDGSVPEGLVRVSAQNSTGHTLTLMMTADEAKPYLDLWTPYKEAVDAAIAADSAWPVAPTVTLHIELGG